MRVVWIALAILVVVGTALPLLRHEAWWVRSLDFPRGQIFLLGLAAGVGLLVWGDLRSALDVAVLVALLIGLVYQGARILPYTPLWRKQVVDATADDPDRAISLMVANVLMSNRDSDRLLGMLQETDPDVFLALEPDAWWEERFEGLVERLPHTVREPRDNRYGMLLYSRLELLEPEVKFLIRDDIPSFHTRLKLRSGAEVWLHCMHPEPPSPTEADESTERDAELLLVGKEVKRRGHPAIVCGDFNDVAWSDTTLLFQKISGLLDPRRGRGMFNTFNARNPLLRCPLDHVFHSPAFALQEMKRMPDFGSDHFPVYARLSMEGRADAEQEPPTPEPEDVQQAEEKIAEAGQNEPV